MDRDAWILLLNNAQQGFTGDKAEQWFSLMQKLRLPMDNYPFVTAALAQNRWRQAKNPKTYLRIVAIREARKAQPLSVSFEQPIDITKHDLGDVAGMSMLRGSSMASKREDGIWRRGSGYTDDNVPHDNEQDDGIPSRNRGTFRQFLLDHVPSHFKEEVQYSAKLLESVEYLNERLGPDDTYICLPPPAIN